MKLLLLVILAVSAHAQTVVNGNWDFLGLFTATGGFLQPRGTSLPATCTIGQSYFKTDATAGQNIYGCTSSNAWTQQGGTGSAISSLTGDGTASGPGAAVLTLATVTVGKGGTGRTSLTNHGVLVGASTSAVTQLAAAAVDTALMGGGASADPSFVALANCTGANKALTYDTATHTFGCNTGVGIVNLTSSSSDPSGSATGPSSSNLSLAYNTVDVTLWAYLAAWRKMLLVDPSATFLINGNIGTAPGTPASGTVNIYSDSTNKGLSAKDDFGNVTRTVKPTACSGGTPVMGSIGADGSVTCVTASGGGGAIPLMTGWGGSDGGAHNIPASTSQWFPVGHGTLAQGGGTTDDSLEKVTLQRSGTFGNLCIDTFSSQPGAGTLVATFVKNSTDTALTKTIAASATAGHYCDTTHTVALSSGDTFSVKIRNNDPSTVSAYILLIYVELQ